MKSFRFYFNYRPLGSKSKRKSKGARKVRSADVVLNHRLLSWRVVDRGFDLSAYSGASASDIVRYLNLPYHDDRDFDYEEEERVEVEKERAEEENLAEVPTDLAADLGFLEVEVVSEDVVEDDWCVISEIRISGGD